MDSQREAEILGRLDELERKVDRLYEHTDIEQPQRWGFGDEPGAGDVDTSDLELLVQQGNKIEAIKRYRERTGVGLKEAKDAIDRLDVGR